MATNTSAADATNFTLDSGLDKDTLAELLPTESRAAFLAGCAQVERDLTRACAANGDTCLASGCALEGESCLNAVLKAGSEYNKACGRIWLPLFRSSRPGA